MEACPLVDFSPNGQGSRHSWGCPLGYACADRTVRRNSTSRIRGSPPQAVEPLWAARRWNGLIGGAGAMQETYYRGHLISSLAILPVGGGVISLGWRSRFAP